MTECSICYDAISSATGQVTLACSHVYHLGCVGRWFQDHSSCPLCRAEPCEKERIVADEEEEEEGEEEEEEEEEIPSFDEEAHAFWVMRTTFEKLERGEGIASEADPKHFVPSKESHKGYAMHTLIIMEERGGYETD